jgi:hypothetical protein
LTAEVDSAREGSQYAKIFSMRLVLLMIAIHIFPGFLSLLGKSRMDCMSKRFTSDQYFNFPAENSLTNQFSLLNDKQSLQATMHQHSGILY